MLKSFDIEVEIEGRKVKVGVGPKFRVNIGGVERSIGALGFESEIDKDMIGNIVGYYDLEDKRICTEEELDEISKTMRYLDKDTLNVDILKAVWARVDGEWRECLIEDYVYVKGSAEEVVKLLVARLINREDVSKSESVYMLDASISGDEADRENTDYIVIKEGSERYEWARGDLIVIENPNVYWCGGNEEVMDLTLCKFRDLGGGNIVGILDEIDGEEKVMVRYNMGLERDFLDVEVLNK